MNNEKLSGIPLRVVMENGEVKDLEVLDSNEGKPFAVDISKHVLNPNPTSADYKTCIKAHREVGAYLQKRGDNYSAEMHEKYAKHYEFALTQLVAC